MYVFLAILITLTSILLIGAVLIQKSKGGGLASNYAGGNQYMGYRKTTDFIEKATWTLAIVICVLSICCSFAVKAPHESASHIVSEKSAPAPAPAPGAEAAQAPAAATPAAASAAEATPAPEAAPAEAPAAAPAANTAEKPAPAAEQK